MKNRRLTVLFTVLMFITVIYTACYVPAVSQLRYQLDESEKSLETNQGREKKQIYELGQTIASLPAIQLSLDVISPLAQQAHEEVLSLKEKRKLLRSEKKKLEEMAASTPETEVDTHE